jgi:segregation and condensation protein B
MSLKAKLEAVIYAAEEPITLAQLAAIFAADAFEWKAEQEALRAEQAEAEANANSATPLLLLNEEGTAEPGLESALGQAEEPAPEVAEAATAKPGTPSEPTPVEDAASAEPSQTEPSSPESASIEPTPELSASDAEPGAELGESDLKRQARQRDREVRAVLRQILDELIADYAADSRGVEVREIAGGYRMATKPECHDAVRMFVKSLKPPLKLSLPALETLAVIAYKQPITAPEVNEIRGVDSSGVFGSLLARKLIATAGRKQVIGRPILYKTTKEFLLRFGLKDVNELPSMEEFEKMAAIELEEPESASEGTVTEIGEPEPIAPDETAEAIAEDLEEELVEAAAEATEVGVVEHTTEPAAGQIAEQAAESAAEGEAGQPVAAAVSNSGQ